SAPTRSPLHFWERAGVAQGEGTGNGLAIGPVLIGSVAVAALFHYSGFSFSHFVQTFPTWAHLTPVAAGLDKVKQILIDGGAVPGMAAVVLVGAGRGRRLRLTRNILEEAF